MNGNVGRNKKQKMLKVQYKYITKRNGGKKNSCGGRHISFKKLEEKIEENSTRK